MPVSLLEHIITGRALPAAGKFLPSPGLRNLIDGFWIMPCSTMETGCLALNDGLPVMGFLSRKEDSLEFTGIDGTYRVQGAWLSSRYLENTTVRLHGGRGKLLIVRFHPPAFFNLFRTEARTLNQRPAWQLPEALGETGRMLQKYVLTAATAEERTGRIAQFISERAGEAYSRNYVLERAMDLIRAAKGRASLAQVAGSLKVNYKWLERNFLKNTGFSPKDFARLQRFINAYVRLKAGKGDNLAALAAACGYYDQSHFTREFKRFTGKPPLKYLAASAGRSVPCTADDFRLLPTSG